MPPVPSSFVNSARPAQRPLSSYGNCSSPHSGFAPRRLLTSRMGLSNFPDGSFLSRHTGMNLSTPTNRRRFLRQSAATLGAAIVAPTIIPASALGRGGARAPSERITMGFIGVGGQGSGHLLGGAWTYVPGGYSARRDVQVLAV